MTNDDPRTPQLMRFRSQMPQRERRSLSARKDLVASYLPALMLVTDWSRLRGRQHGELLRASVEGGVTVVQMRDRLPVSMPSSDPDSAELIDVPDDARGYVKEMMAASTETIVLGAAVLGASVAARGALVLVQGGRNPSVAAATVLAVDDVGEGPIGLHLAEYARADTSTPTDRSSLGERIIVSFSIHSLEAAVQAERDGADMLVLGTVFPSKSHPGGPTIGLEGVRAVCQAVHVPVIAIGGITAQNAGDVIRAGASGVAVISAIFDAPDPRAAAAELRAAIDEAWAQRGSVAEELTDRGTEELTDS